MNLCLLECLINPLCPFKSQIAPAAQRNPQVPSAEMKMAKHRIEEIMVFAGEMIYNRLGMSFCIALRNEAGALEKIFPANITGKKRRRTG